MKWKNWAALGLMLVFAVVAMGHSSDHRVRRAQVVKQNGGSTGDSVTAAADTGTAITLPVECKSFWVTSQADTTARIFVDVSANGTNWVRYSTDSTSATNESFTTRSTEDLFVKSGGLAGYQVRVITDPINAPAATSFIRSYVYWETR